jgi:hypothetical protein
MVCLCFWECMLIFRVVLEQESRCSEVSRFVLFFLLCLLSGFINVADYYMYRQCIITRTEEFLSFGPGHIGVRSYLLGMPHVHT